MIAQIDKRINRALGAIRLAFRGVVSHVNTAPAIMLVQADGLNGEQLQAAEYFQHYGFTSNPPAGAMMVVLPIGGKTAHGIVVATEHAAFRIKGLQSGETAIYNNNGDKIVIHIDGTIEVVASSKVQITSPLVTMSGNLNVTGNIVANGDISDHTNKSMAGMRTTYNGHTHNDPQGGAVGVPNQGM